MVSHCKVQESPRPPSLLTHSASSGAPKTTIRPGNSLEVLAGLREAGTLPVTVYYSKGVQRKDGPGKRRTGQDPGVTRPKLPGVPSRWSCADTTGPVSPSGDVWRVRRLVIRGGSLEPWFPEFYWVLALALGPSSPELCWCPVGSGHRGCWPVVFLSSWSRGLVLVSGFYWLQAKLGSVSSSPVFWKSLWRIAVNSLNNWSQWAIYIWAFLCWKPSHYERVSVLVLGLIVYFFSSQFQLFVSYWEFVLLVIQYVRM